MKTIHLRYLLPATLVTELQNLFPNWDGVTRDITGIDKHAYYKTETVDILGVPTEVHDVYLLVPDDFEIPAFLTSNPLLGKATHHFMGHEPTI